MDRVELDGIDVEFEVTGSGDQVALLHARPFVGWYAPLVEALSGCSVLRYFRATPLDGRPFGVDDDAAVCARLLHHVGFDRPHVVGHSYGGILALALARSGAVALRSLALLEPAPVGFLPPEQAESARAPLLELYRSRGPAAAAEQFARGILGDDALALLDRFLPGSFDEFVAHAEGFFRVELPALVHWRLEPDDAGRIEQPILNVVGTESVPRFLQGADIVQASFPESIRWELQGAGHLLMARQPGATASRLAEFWA